ncbi:hypothetical protein PP175_26545 (plasmid) [Aneurinibacillus sp. Ricciae_BoGa-3]|uniref:hypothetical protein n=1 Tax=Aneurinibacillus sp. Ricciae_BoGa-3 TaxID=3022697 RepID=UPI00233F9177|nr:hypothetical protein [Aneurinibacillus sp. Ricciae_BoGa-3]WCK57625.1 hypothetical protein PP175_26545 [Aneurinibacillus sp. Ricciae_BoGa-3]
MVLWEFFARIIIFITKVCFKVLSLFVLLFLFVSYTNIGGTMDAIKYKYYMATGKELTTQSVMNDMQQRMQQSTDNLNQVSNMMNQTQTTKK